MRRGWDGRTGRRALLAALAITGSLVAAPAAASAATWVPGATFPASAPAEGSGYGGDLTVDPSNHDVLAVGYGSYPCDGCLSAGGPLRTFRNGVQTRSVPLGAFAPNDVAVDSSDHTAYIADQSAAVDGTGAGVSIVAGTTVRRIALKQTLYASQVAVDPTTHTAYVLSKNPTNCFSPFGCPLPDPDLPSTPPDELSVIRGGALVATIPVKAWSGDVAVDPSTHTVYVTETESDTIAVINGTSVTRRIAATRPQAIGVDSATHDLYVGVNTGRFGPARLLVMNGSTVTASIASLTQGLLGDIAVDSTAHAAFVAGRDGELLVFDKAGLVQTVDGVQGFTVAVDASNGTAYASSGEQIKSYVPSTRPVVQRGGPNDNDLAPPASGAPVYAIFSQAMDKASTQAAFTLRRYDDGTPVSVPGTFAWYGDRVMVFTPAAGLRSEQSYSGTVETTAKDTGGRTLIAAKTWFFTAPAVAAASAPVVTSPDQSSPLTPCVYPKTPFYAIYGSPLDTASLAGRVTLRTSAGAALPGSLGFLGTQILGFVPTSPLALGSSGSLSIAGWTAGGAPVSSTITYANVVKEPTISSIGPVNNATGVSRTAPPVYAVFAQAMDKTRTAAAITVERASDGAAVAGTIAWVGTQVAGWTPSATLAAGTRYTVTVAPTAFDGRGCQLAGATSWSFTTLADRAGSTARKLAAAATEPVDAGLAAMRAGGNQR